MVDKSSEKQEDHHSSVKFPGGTILTSILNS